MALNDLQIRALKATDRIYKKADAGGLYIEVHPSGSKLWRMKYIHLRKEKRLTLGRYPNVSLAEARQRRDEMKRKLRDGIWSRKRMASARPSIDQICANNGLKSVAGRNRNCGGNGAGGGRIGDHSRNEDCGPGPIPPQQHRRQRETRRWPDWRCAGMNRGEGEAAFCQDEIDHSNRDQAAGIPGASAKIYLRR